MQRTFLRSATQATDSTLMGCKREQRRHEETRPEAVRGPHQQQKKQDHVHGMQQDAGEMMPGGIQAKQRDIEGVRHPGERMPVGLLGRGQSPFESIGGQALTNVRVLGDVTVIVIVHEGMAIDGVVESQRYHREKQADDRVALLAATRRCPEAPLRCGVFLVEGNIRI